MVNFYFGSIIVFTWIYLIFIFDHVILDGFIKTKIKNWLSNMSNSSCDQDCDQGRRCTCCKNSAGKQ